MQLKVLFTAILHFYWVGKCKAKVLVLSLVHITDFLLQSDKLFADGSGIIISLSCLILSEAV